MSLFTVKINPSKPAHKYSASPQASSPEREVELSASMPRSTLFLFCAISSGVSVIPCYSCMSCLDRGRCSGLLRAARQGLSLGEVRVGLGLADCTNCSGFVAKQTASTLLLWP